VNGHLEQTAETAALQLPYSKFYCDSDLEGLIRRWPELHPEVRRAIVAMTQANDSRRHFKASSGE
jgi:hypothetical protein